MKLIPNSKNIGIMDRLLRIVLGILIIYYGLMIDSFIAIIGAIIIFSAAVGKCPLYNLLNISTCKKTNLNNQSDASK